MRKLGRYALLHRFASGDHGDVYLARLTDRLPGGELAVGDVCAVKVIRGDVAGDIEHSRLLLAEGATAVRFRHRAAARVHEVERVGAEPYVAMDYCAGQTVGAILQRESSQGAVLPPRLAAFVCAEVAAVLYAATQRAWSPSGAGPMVHGGLSPRSVLVDYTGEVKVLGIGGGRARMYLPVPKSRLAYAAPEVLQERPPDRRTDLFALGVLLHDLLTGTRLFRRATDAETRDAIVEGRPPDVVPAIAPIDRELARLVASMLERASDRRPRDAEEVEEALRAFAGDPAQAQEELSIRLDRGFREEREAQRRVVDAAVRRAGPLPGARPPPTRVAEARPASVTTRGGVESYAFVSERPEEREHHTERTPVVPASSERPGRAVIERGASAIERAPSRAGSAIERAPSRAGSAIERAPAGSPDAPLPRPATAREPVRDPVGTQRDIPQMMRPITSDRAAAAREASAGPRTGGSALRVPSAAEQLAAPAAPWARAPVEPELDEVEPITISGMPAVRGPRAAREHREDDARAAPLRLIPVDGAPRASADLDDLLPELFPNSVPLLSEREEPATLDLAARVGLELRGHLADEVRENLEIRPDASGGTPIPLTRRSAKPDKRDLAEATWEGELGDDPELPAWGHNLDQAPTFALAMGPVAQDDGLRGVPVADAEGSLRELLDSGQAEAVEPPADAVISDPGGGGVLRYRRGRQLGVSEIATVFEAQDAVLGRTVALKISDVGDEAGATIDRDTRIRVLRREARLAAGLFHPRMPALLDAGRDGDLFYLAYQLVEGQDLDRLVAERGPLSPARARVIVRDVAEALAHLHGRSLSHGDVSAANVLVEPDGRARLIDFSMSVAQGSDHPLGRAHDPAADARALGKLGVWMVAGGPRPTDVAKLDPELAAILARLEATRGSTADLAAVKAALDEPARPSSPSGPKAPAARIPAATSSPSTRIPAAHSSPGAPSPLDARERPAAPLGIGYDAIAQGYEAHLRRGTAYDPPDRDPAGPLARALARRLGLGAESEAVAALLLAARALTHRFDMKARQAVAEGLLAPVIGARVVELDERLSGGRDADPEPTPLEVATVVEAYAGATQADEEGRRLSPRRAVLALRERADEGRFDGRVVEALIDHLRSTISALEIAPRERIAVVGLAAEDPVVQFLAARGFPLEIHADADPAAVRGMLQRSAWGVVVERTAARRLTERLRAEGRADVRVVIVGGGLDDTLDEGGPLGSPVRAEILPRGAPPERVLAALAERARPR